MSLTGALLGMGSRMPVSFSMTGFSGHMAEAAGSNNG